MESIAQQLKVEGVPPHVSSWSVAGIHGFVLAVLNRWQREHGELPAQFQMVMCPQVEINAMGGLPPRVHELTDPRLRCRHFTGCNRPYFVVLFTGADAEHRAREAQELLSWSERYAVTRDPHGVCLAFAGATEDLLDEEREETPARTLQMLLASGELVSILG